MTTLREAAQQALKAMGSIGADAICEASHHAKKDQHQVGDPCPLQQRWHIAFQSFRAALAEPPVNQCGETCERAKLCAVCARELP